MKPHRTRHDTPAPSAQAEQGANGRGEIARHVEALHRLLQAQFDAHQRLFAAIDRQREAIRAADADELARAAAEAEGLVRLLAAADHQRTQIVHALQRLVAPSDAGALTLTGLMQAAALDGERREAMAKVARELRERVESVKRLGAIVRDAAQTLSNHMAGIQQTVHSALSRARVYERRGRLNLGAAVPAAVDMKS